MPAEVTVNASALTLSSEFRYVVADESDAIYAGDDQRSEGLTNERQLKPGDKIDSIDHVVVVSPGNGVLLQFSHDEAFPSDEPKAKAKPKAKKK